MSEAIITVAPFLLARKAACHRYSISMRELEYIYKRDPEFPIVRVGRKVLVHRDSADEYFTRYIREVIETGE